MIIRAAVPSDETAIAALHAASWQFAYRGALSDSYLAQRVVADRVAVWRERFREPSPRQRVLVADDGTDVVGFACAFLDEDPAWGCLLDNLHVSRGFQGHGLGARLLAETAGFCRASVPPRALHLYVLASNAAAQRFYLAQGAAVVGSHGWDAPDGQHLLSLQMAWTADRLPRPRGP
ncbi:MAG TPA: GNAT family N-acetyltransferase [Burkholderiaceae bacterium]|nr:GNAT family N-acetyltransferase [Burkholderiaceae bacterium]